MFVKASLNIQEMESLLSLNRDFLEDSKKPFQQSECVDHGSSQMVAQGNATLLPTEAGSEFSSGDFPEHGRDECT